jgi:hypothetical protein
MKIRRSLPDNLRNWLEQRRLESQKEKELRDWWNHVLSTNQRKALLKEMDEHEEYRIAGVDVPMLMMEKYKGREWEIKVVS